MARYKTSFSKTYPARPFWVELLPEKFKDHNCGWKIVSWKSGWNTVSWEGGSDLVWWEGGWDLIWSSIDETH